MRRKILFCFLFWLYFLGQQQPAMLSSIHRLNRKIVILQFKYLEDSQVTKKQPYSFVTQIQNPVQIIVRMTFSKKCGHVFACAFSEFFLPSLE
jgi:hypothetical protein